MPQGALWPIYLIDSLDIDPAGRRFEDSAEKAPVNKASLENLMFGISAFCALPLLRAYAHWPVLSGIPTDADGTSTGSVWMGSTQRMW